MVERICVWVYMRLVEGVSKNEWMNTRVGSYTVGVIYNTKNI